MGRAAQPDIFGSDSDIEAHNGRGLKRSSDPIHASALTAYHL